MSLMREAKKEKATEEPFIRITKKDGDREA